MSAAVFDRVLSRVRSPIRLERKHDPFFEKLIASGEWPRSERVAVVRWRVVGPLLAVRFRAVKRPDWTALLTRSAKQPGKWQLTTFDEQGPWGDVVRETAEKALQDGLAGDRWRIECIVDGTGRQIGRRC